MKPDRQPPRRAWGIVFMLACPLPLHAQPEPPAPAPTEQARRLADSPFRWIMINGAIKDKDNKDKDKDKKAAKAAASSKPAESAASAASAAPRSPPPQAEATAEPTGPAAEPAEPVQTEAAVAASVPTPAAPVSAKPSAEPPALRIVKRVLPEPPERLIMSGEDNRVMVQFIVLPDGSVTSVKVVSSTNVRLNPHVVSAVEQWRYAEADVPRSSRAGFVFRTHRE